MRSDGRRTARRAIRAGIVTLGTLVVAACAARAVGGGPAPSSEDVLVPGASGLSTASFGTENVASRVVSDSGPGTDARTIGSTVTGIRATEYHGRAALVLTAMSRRGAMTFVDTALVLRDGLVPVWETAANSRDWHARFDYDGATVRVDATTPDSVHRVTHTYPRPAFGFNELDAIVRAIPLRDGYHTIVALYSEGSDALEMDTLAVSAPRDGGAWTVRFADPVIITHYSVDGASRRIVDRVVTYHRTPIRLRYVADSTSS